MNRTALKYILKKLETEALPKRIQILKAIYPTNLADEDLKIKELISLLKHAELQQQKLKLMFDC